MTTNLEERTTAVDLATANRIETVRQELSQNEGRPVSVEEVKRALVVKGVELVEHGLPWKDPRAVRAWLEEMKAHVAKIAEVTDDQAAPPEDRVHGPAGALRLLDAAVIALRGQLVVAERGLDVMQNEARRPEVILRALAANWTAQNPSGIVAEAEREEVSPDKVRYWFALVVPALDGYRCRLFCIEHGREIYPLRIAMGQASDATEVLNVEGFCAVLPTFFAAAETVQAVQAVRQRIAEQVPAGSTAP